MPTKQEWKCYITLLENERKKASKKALIAEHPTVRKGWEQVGIAIKEAIVLMRRELER